MRTDTEDEWFQEDWAILQCQGCGSIAIRRDEYNTLDRMYMTDGDEELIHRVSFPLESERPGSISGTEHLPHEVRRVYDETRAAIPDLPVLAGIGLRAIIEAVCNDQGVKGTLVAKIEALRQNGRITNDHKDLLDRSRIVGKAAAHEMKPPDVREMMAILEIVEHLLNGVYIVPRKNAQLGVKP